MGSSLPTQIAAIAQRSVLRTVRQPAVIISALLFPMMFFSINAYGLDAAARIPGFPADSYMDFAFAFPLIQASLFGAVTAGADLARDIESGFFDRLKLTPMRPVSLLLGMLAGIVALGLLQEGGARPSAASTGDSRGSGGTLAGHPSFTWQS
jgi:ABC-2 type transport system permease protein